MRFPLPLRFTIPTTLLLFGLFLGGLSFAYEVTSAFKRIEEDIHRRAVFLGNQISEMLHYHFQNGDIEAAERQIHLLGANPNLSVAIVCDEKGNVLLSSRQGARDAVVENVVVPLGTNAIFTAREKMAAQFTLADDKNTLFAAFPFPMPPDTDTLEFSGAGVLYFEYDLLALKQSELIDVRRRSGAIAALLGVACLCVWFFFDRTLTRRVMKLSLATQRLAKGTLASRAKLKGSDELAELSKSFDEMADNIRIRTAELEATNQKMKHEIAEREQAENRFLSVWKNSVDGMRLTDQNGNVVAVNEAYCALVEMSPEELHGRPFHMCYDTRISAEMLETYRQRFANRSFQTFIERQLKFRCGKVIDLEVACSFIAQDNDEPLLLSIFRDITERKRTEEILNQQSASMEASMDGMAIHDKNGNFVYLNESHARIYGYQAKELIGKGWHTLYDEKELRRFDDEVMPVFWKAGRWHGEAVGRRRDGTTFPQEISLSRIETGGLVCVVRDITERKLEEERRKAIDRKLLDAQKLESLGVLAGGIAHDFNNLLTAIMGNAGLALMLEPEEPLIRSYLQNIEKTSVQAADLCKQMLAYSGRGRFVIQHLDLNALIVDMQHLLQISVNKRVVLKYELADSVPAIEGDPSQMRQVVMNLVINASEAIGEKNGVVTVRTGVRPVDRTYLAETYLSPELPEGSYVFMEVSDTGCGMTPGTKAKIFEPFFTTKFTGRGLGLAAVLGIIRGHKGAIRVYSEVGQGTTFKFVIPAIEAPAEALQRELDAPLVWTGRGTILVVDDEETVRAVTSEMLNSIGFEVITACDGREGVEVFARNCERITAVVMDLTMPHMNGEEAFREMRRMRGDLKVILVSGYSEQDATARFAGKGLAGFVQKPFKLEEFRRKLRGVLSDTEIFTRRAKELPAEVKPGASAVSTAPSA